MSNETPYPGADNLEVMKEAVNYNQFLKDLVTSHVEDDSAVLDFGAGVGTFSGSIPGTTARTTCVEPDAAARETLQQQGYTVFSDLAQLQPETYTYIFSLNVLEHVDDDGAALNNLYTSTRPDGRIFIYVPAFNHIRTRMDDLVGHHRRYTKPELETKLTAAGFQVEDSGYTDFLGYFASLLVRLMEACQREPGGTINRQLLVVYDRLAFPVSRLLSRVFKSVVGKNVYAVARKQV